MGRFNQAKANQKRERNLKLKQDEFKGGSQLGVNQKAMNIQCKICFQTFLCTSKKDQLTVHAENKHGKSFEDCFPNFDDNAQEEGKKIAKEVKKKEEEEK